MQSSDPGESDYVDAEAVLESLVEAIHDRHGFDVTALDMTDYPLLVDLFLIASSDNRIQSRAIADSVRERARGSGLTIDHAEGYDEGSWILLDISGIVVHIFLPDRREYYNLELLWNDAPRKDFVDEGRPPEADGR